VFCSHQTRLMCFCSCFCSFLRAARLQWVLLRDGARRREGRWEGMYSLAVGRLTPVHMAVIGRALRVRVCILYTLPPCRCCIHVLHHAHMYIYIYMYVVASSHAFILQMGYACQVETRLTSK
jgi:hypothetical protein